MTRIAYFVDVHDRFDVIPALLPTIGAVDVLLVGGDITTAGRPADLVSALRLWEPLAPRLLAVAGNMDSAAIDRELETRNVSLNARGVVLNDIGLFGVSAAPLSPLATPYELTEQALAARIDRAWAMVQHCERTIFCPHAPPARTHCDRLESGEHVGSTAVREFIEEHQPDLVLCGHIHESRGTDRIGASRIVNPGPAAAMHYALVDVDGRVSVRLDA